MTLPTPSIHEDIQFILWDWNGTLLDDLQLCLGTVNGMLERRQHHKLSTERYRDIFTFPVRDYYVKAGFDFSREPFDELAVEFIDGYYGHFQEAPLHAHALEALDAVRRTGLSQGVLSATEDSILKKSLNDHGICEYFSEVRGIHNHHADGKLAVGRALVQGLSCLPGQILLVGDTLHDAEVAHALGIHCMLISYGHQSAQRLQQSGLTVLPDLQRFVRLLETGNKK